MFTEFPFNAVPFCLRRLTLTFLEHYQHQLLTPQSLEQYADFLNPSLGTWALYVNVSYAHVWWEQNRAPLIKSVIHNKLMWDLWNYSIDTPLVCSHWGMLTTFSSPWPWCPGWWRQAVDRFWKNRMTGSPGHRVQLQAQAHMTRVWTFVPTPLNPLGSVQHLLITSYYYYLSYYCTSVGVCGVQHYSVIGQKLGVGVVNVDRPPY